MGCFSRRAGDHHDLFFIEDVNGPAAHAAGDNGGHALFMQEVGQKSGFMAGVGYYFLFDNLPVVRIKKGKGFTMTKMFRNIFANGGNSYFHHLSISRLLSKLIVTVNIE